MLNDRPAARRAPTRRAPARVARRPRAVNLAIRDALVRVQGSALAHDVRVDPRAGTLAWHGRPRDVSAFAWQPPVAGAVYGTLLNDRAALAALGEAAGTAAVQGAAEGAGALREAAQHAVGVRLADRRSGRRPALAMGACLGVVIGRTACRVRARRRARLRRRLHGRERRQRAARQLLPPDRSAIECRDGFCPIGAVGRSRAGTCRIPTRSRCASTIDGAVRQRARPARSCARSRGCWPTSPSS